MGTTDVSLIVLLHSSLHCPCPTGTQYYVFALDCPVEGTTIFVTPTSQGK